MMAETLAPTREDAFRHDFAVAVVEGLSARNKRIPCRFLYDALGSALFDEITRLDEYYPTRTEIALLHDRGQDIARLAEGTRAVIEFGSGSSVKTAILLDALRGVGAYIPIDIAGAALAGAVKRLRRRYPDLVVAPLNADFTTLTKLPASLRGVRRLGFFPGSTIGNFEPAEARAFLAQAGRLLGADGALLIGVDLRKDLARLLPAYDDALGVTAAFNLNLLARVNRELGGTFDVGRFAHEAVWNEIGGRVEMHLVSRASQEVRVLGRRFRFRAGERIHTENSHKYTLEGFADLAAAGGWRTAKAWTDPDRLFSVHYLLRARPGAGDQASTSSRT